MILSIVAAFLVEIESILFGFIFLPMSIICAVILILGFFNK